VAAPAGRSQHDRQQTPQLNDEPAHRPQALLLSFFGGVVRGSQFPPIPTAVFLKFLGELAVGEPAARATLARLARNGLLERGRAGRTTRFALTPAGHAVVEQGALRVEAESPFFHPEGQWTLLSYSLPESRRDVRHQLRAALAWAGFGRLRDGLWIAPGVVDVDAVFGRTEVPEARASAEWFSATPLPGVDVGQLIRRAWPVEQIRAQHHAFLARWAAGPSEQRPLSQITLLGADWLALLRTDPGLPASELTADWPADETTQAYRRCYRALLPAARRELDVELRRRSAS